MESSRDPIGNPQGSGRLAGDVCGMQNEKLGLHRCDVGRECNAIALVSDASELASWKWESAGHVIDQSDESHSR